ncbi:magnesium transporter CorA family protein [Methanosphaerula palustris]|uniref:Mg2 transporter protein CorA family protein n=1 Tax=Methanosphaerula palustris (strain ATCC BAA-1556 / DSM 19958 / E1-9c) TaxID=521011 RepID=B8GKH5_METPE|nr:magnesium transporter CorA family protein [Methanosphaerula palustris]ACL15858.1 Mg2 transporter protein CorA family protein [Methanosphaerula palustris E1-9c]
MQIYKTRKGSEPAIIEIVETICEGSWIWLLEPSEAELAIVADQCRIPPEFLQAALDEEERPRIDSEDDVVLIVMDIPMTTESLGVKILTTHPLGIIITRDHIVTICSRRVDVLDDVLAGKIRQFTTVKKTRFLFQIFYRNATYYLNHLRRIERKMTQIEVELRRSMKNEELFQMMELEKSLIYFSTSLKSNEAVLERILRTKILKMYEEDAELLEDVIIENKQAMEMSQIYLHILTGMTQSFASIISNNLNIVMRFLASVTIILAIPTMIASFYGMNVIEIPLSQYPFSFELIFGIAVLLAVGMGLMLWRKKML